MRGLYDQVEGYLQEIPYEEIWPGFEKMDFAIYNQDLVFLKDKTIARDDRFIASTVIDFEGKELAIFEISDKDKTDPRILAADLVHEFFHGFQNKQGENRFPDELVALDYPREYEIYQIKRKENQILSSCLGQGSHDEKKRECKRFLALRKKRFDKYGPSIEYEFLIERVEGCAEYCGTKALKYISQEFYKKRVRDYREKISQDTELLYNIRKMAYFTGTLFLLVLDDLGIDFDRHIPGKNQTILEEIQVKWEITEMADEDLPDIRASYENFIRHRQKIFDDYFAKEPTKKLFHGYICGFDPMNMIKQGHRLWCKNFILLRSSQKEEDIFLKGPLVVALKDDSLSEVLAYYKSEDGF